MRTATLYRYSVPMEAGVILRHQRLKSRDGLLVKLQQGELSGWGEIAPLPEFSQENTGSSPSGGRVLAATLGQWCRIG